MNFTASVPFRFCSSANIARRFPNKYLFSTGGYCTLLDVYAGCDYLINRPTKAYILLMTCSYHPDLISSSYCIGNCRNQRRNQATRIISTFPLRLNTGICGIPSAPAIRCSSATNSFVVQLKMEPGVKCQRFSQLIECSTWRNKGRYGGQRLPRRTKHRAMPDIVCHVSIQNGGASKTWSNAGSCFIGLPITHNKGDFSTRHIQAPT
ncbi:hypothetical protein VI06_19920 [Aquitalea magnusonii]|nr:hypothetical protein VI06_19920 [Aquitalea magnusonii]